ncbi:hypothetical protein [Paenibacillus polymyxa]|uniref:hypothetical protein n=1 Tax=Paenibacillus polymyxa TaxID=1406 RepID=UPI0025B70A0E|nr:hypothetical protein [Paenibacillus polymyxa]MDN4106083.1 hypothetical protein [Paenibacillus polymyxa]
MNYLSQLNDGITIIYTDTTGKSDLVSPEWVLMKLYEGHSFSNETFQVAEVSMKDGIQINIGTQILIDVPKERVVKGVECVICETIYDDHVMDCPKCPRELQEELLCGLSIFDKYYIKN